MEKEKKYKALGSKVAQLQMKLDQKQAMKASPSASGAKLRTSEVQAVPTGVNGRNSLMNNRGSAAGIFDESHEVITALHEENQRLHHQLDEQEEEMQKLKAEIRNLRNWQKSKEVDEKVQKIAHRDQENKDLTYLYTLESEYEKLRTFVCESMGLPIETGSITGALQPPSSLSSSNGPPSSRPGAISQPSERSLNVAVSDCVGQERCLGAEGGRSAESAAQVRWSTQQRKDQDQLQGKCPPRSRTTGRRSGTSHPRCTIRSALSRGSACSQTGRRAIRRSWTT
ncbi:hypothetical protein PINS_up015317 [Pythium insidiosum]|nr:hypothetical protein PINS_up015317 [Pythium insidiosum]